MCCFLYVELVRFVFLFGWWISGHFFIFFTRLTFSIDIHETSYMEKMYIQLGFSPSSWNFYDFFVTFARVLIVHRFHCPKSAYMMNFLIDLHTSLSFYPRFLSTEPFDLFPTQLMLMLMMMMSFLHLMRLGSVRKQFFYLFFILVYQPSAPHHHRMEMKSSEKEWMERWKDLYRFKLAPNSSTDREREKDLPRNRTIFLNLDVGIKIRLKRKL